MVEPVLGIGPQKLLEFPGAFDLEGIGRQVSLLLKVGGKPEGKLKKNKGGQQENEGHPGNFAHHGLRLSPGRVGHNFFGGKPVIPVFADVPPPHRYHDSI